MNIAEQTVEVLTRILQGNVGVGMGSAEPVNEVYTDEGVAILLRNALDEAGLLASDPPDEGEVMSFNVTGNNSHLIENCFKLGYLTDDMAILDPTYGMGVFWKRHRPPLLLGTDLDPTKSPGGRVGTLVVEPGSSLDFTQMPWLGSPFDAVVFDPDYKMQGTHSGDGPAAMNPRFGMDRDYQPVDDHLDRIGLGLRECVRVTKPGGMVLAKCMSAVVSGSTVWQDIILANTLEALGCRLVGRMWLLGHRKQPTHDPCRPCEGQGWRALIIDDIRPDLPHGATTKIACEKCGGEGKTPRRQVHERHNASCLLITQKAKS